MICPWRAPVPPSGRGNLNGTRMPTKRGSDRMFSRGIFTTDLSRGRESVRAGPATSRNALEERRIAGCGWRCLGIWAPRLFSKVCANSNAAARALLDGPKWSAGTTHELFSRGRRLL